MEAAVAQKRLIYCGAVQATPFRLVRLGTLLFAACFLFFALFSHAHFKGSDEVAIFEMTRSIAEGRGLAVPALRHTQIGKDGRRYSYFSPGQSVLALPLYAAARAAEKVLPRSAIDRLRGPEIQGGRHVYGGDLAISVLALYGPLVGALLVLVFFRLELDFGASLGAALVAAGLLATTTQVALHSAYFLRHSTEALCFVSAFWLLRRFGEGRGLRTLWIASALAALAFLVRVPAAIVAPALGGYVAWVIWLRGLSPGARRDARWLAHCLAAVLLPVVAALALHAGANFVRWGTWLSSPMVGQDTRFENSLLRGLQGLLVSPGSSLFVYSPLLLLLPWTIVGFARRFRAETLFIAGLSLSVLLVYAKFDGWTGLWSAPGPRYLFVLIPFLMLPLGPWLGDRSGARASTRLAKWTAVAMLGAAGLCVQLLCLTVRWGSVPNLAAWPVLDPDGSNFLFEPSRSPLVVIARLLAQGGPRDPWILRVAEGWPGVAAAPGLAGLLVGAWLLAFCLVVYALARETRRISP